MSSTRLVCIFFNHVGDAIRSGRVYLQEMTMNKKLIMSNLKRHVCGSLPKLTFSEC